MELSGEQEEAGPEQNRKAIGGRIRDSIGG
jgi:hypothetical protein